MKTQQKDSKHGKSSLGDLSFYSSVYGDIVRSKGGASKAMIRKSPRFARLREHQKEFSGCAAAGKLFRQGLLVHTREAPDHTLVWRVTKLMNQLKDLDLVSVKGKRTVEAGLKSKAGKELLKGFEFNSHASLDSILKRPVNINKGEFQISHIVLNRDVMPPKGANYIEFTAILSRLDLFGGKHLVELESLMFKLDNKKRSIVFKPVLPKGRGFLIYTLHLRFLCEQGGVTSVMENKKFNCLAVLGVE